MADEARWSAVPNRAETFRRSFFLFPLEALVSVSLEEGSSPTMVSHSLNLFIHVCYNFRTSMDDLETKSWFWFCMEAGNELCSIAFPASFLGESVSCGRWSKYQYSHFLNVSEILKTNLNQVFQIRNIHRSNFPRSWIVSENICYLPPCSNRMSSNAHIHRHERGISRRPDLRVLPLTASTRTFLYWTIFFILESQSKWPP